MSNTPGQDDENEPENGPEDNNPFKGTPFEHLFGAGAPDLSALFGGSGNAPDLGALFGGPGCAPDLGALFSQIQSLMQPHDGPINWDYAIDIARKVVAQSPDPTPTQKQKDAVADAVGLVALVRGSVRSGTAVL